MTLYGVAALAWVAACAIGGLTYIAGSLAFQGAVGHDWRAAVFWGEVCLGAAAPIAIVAATWIERARSSVAALTIWSGVYALGSLLPMLLFRMIWTGFSPVATFEGRLIGLLLLTGCASFPLVYSVFSHSRPH